MTSRYRIIPPDEVAIAILGHREPDLVDGWGRCGSRAKPTGLGIVNLRTREMRIAGQTKSGSGLWHVHGSPDGRWAVGDDFAMGAPGTCGKDGQGVPVGDGVPTLRAHGLTIGGTAA